MPEPTAKKIQKEDFTTESSKRLLTTYLYDLFTTEISITTEY
jgi:hypothetical protein